MRIPKDSQATVEAPLSRCSGAISNRAVAVLLPPFFLFLSIFFTTNCQAMAHPAKGITLNPLFSAHMVLQQHQRVPVWGKGEPGGEVKVTFKGVLRQTTVDKNGNWSVDLPPTGAGGPFSLIISGKETITIPDVMVGEVWICSGQSNMDYTFEGLGIRDTSRVDRELGPLPDIRLLMVDKVMSTHPYENFYSEGWKQCTPESRKPFSAVAYYFGRYLSQKVKVPVGLIQASWGGTPVETWISPPTMNRLQEQSDSLLAAERGNSAAVKGELATLRDLNYWPDKMEQVLSENGALNHGYQQADLTIDAWPVMTLPQFWEEAGLNIDGLVWFCRDLEVPSTWKGEDLVLNLGKVNDFDLTWFNGVKVGRGTDVSEFRVYRVPARLVKPGKNRITVLVLDRGRMGGFYSPDKRMNLTSAKGSMTLTGNWPYLVDPNPIGLDKFPPKRNNNAEAFNGMINPILPYGMRGVIWYQGEANVEWAAQYQSRFKTMIADWRRVWGQGNFPFLFVQLPNFMETKAMPADDPWAEMRESQAGALELPNTGMAVTIDIGEAGNIHPLNKWEVGRRLALNALGTVYQNDIAYSGPLYKSMQIERDRIRIRFTHTFGGLRARGGSPLLGFAIAGEDRQFVWASAKIAGDDVIVWSPTVTKPVAVRYGWASNPVCNLTNTANLPASPFRTDSWEGMTSGRRK